MSDTCVCAGHSRAVLGDDAVGSERVMTVGCSEEAVARSTAEMGACACSGKASAVGGTALVSWEAAEVELEVGVEVEVSAAHAPLRQRRAKA